MKGRKPGAAGALILSALLLPVSSCKDEAPVAPDASEQLQSPSLRAASPYDPGQIRLRPASAGDPAPHDPRSLGMRVICLGGAALGAGEGEAHRFANGLGCEVNTIDKNGIPDEEAIVRTARNRIKGKLLSEIQRLDFFYAGQDAFNGFLRLTIYLDQCAPAENPGTASAGCPPGESTDGEADSRAEIFNRDCNDGDAQVGAARVVDDPSCVIYHGDHSHPNWTDFVTAHPGTRVAQDLDPFILVTQTGHWLVYRVALL
jgi:hypothetical protein